MTHSQITMQRQLPVIALLLGLALALSPLGCQKRGQSTANTPEASSDAASKPTATRPMPAPKVVQIPDLVRARALLALGKRYKKQLDGRTVTVRGVYKFQGTGRLDNGKSGFLIKIAAVGANAFGPYVSCQAGTSLPVDKTRPRRGAPITVRGIYRYEDDPDKGFILTLRGCIPVALN